MASNGQSEKQSSAESTQCKFVKEEQVATGKWLSLNNITYTDPLNKERIWEAVYRTTGSKDDADGVAVIAIVKRTLKYDCVILVKQYRPPVKGYTLEFPAGLVDKGESAETTAVRELKEETGYQGIVKHVSPVTVLDPGMGNTSTRIVTMEIDGDEECNRSPKPNPEESEFIEVLLIPMEDLLSALNVYSSQGVKVNSQIYTYAIAMEQTRKIKPLVPYFSICLFYHNEI